MIRWKIKILALLLLSIFCIFNFVTPNALASSTVNVRVEIYYAKLVQEIDTSLDTTVTLTNPNDSSLVINLPSDVLASDDTLEMTIYALPKMAVIPNDPLPIGKDGGAIFYYISFKKLNDDSPITHFDKPVTLTFNYTDSDISGITENTLNPYRWNGSAWVLLNNVIIDTTLNKITATSQDFSNFGLLGFPSFSCGNGLVETPEQCDAGESNGVCPATCSATCTTNSCSVGGGQGSSRIGGGYISSETNVKFEGLAYPNSTVTLLKDGQIVATARSDTDANFQIYLSNLPSGIYVFAIYSQDSQGRRSSVLTFPLGVFFGATTDVIGIFIAPTITADKVEVKRGSNIVIWGQSVPSAEITVAIRSDQEFSGKTTADKNGDYIFNFDTSLSDTGPHFATARAVSKYQISFLSQTVNFLVATKNILVMPIVEPVGGAINVENPLTNPNVVVPIVKHVVAPQYQKLWSWNNSLVVLAILLVAIFIYLMRKILWENIRRRGNL